MMKERICLTMIVKNEAAVIERCLTSARGIFNTFCIHDTGSSDNTVEIIKKLMHDWNIYILISRPTTESNPDLEGLFNRLLHRTLS